MCKHDWKVKVELFLDIDHDPAFHNLSKKMLRTKHVRVEGANWPKSTAYCNKCGVSYPGLAGGHP